MKIENINNGSSIIKFERGECDSRNDLFKFLETEVIHRASLIYGEINGSPLHYVIYKCRCEYSDEIVSRKELDKLIKEVKDFYGEKQ